MEAELRPLRRFCFYDQVHTTGTDVEHLLNATAVLTLGKDMTLRDYAAIKAMQGDFVSGVHPDNFDATAKRAYKMADAMLKARQA